MPHSQEEEVPIEEGDEEEEEEEEGSEDDAEEDGEEEIADAEEEVSRVHALVDLWAGCRVETS